MTEDDVLGELLAAEHAAVYAYGVLGAHLDTERRGSAVAAYDAHRQLRDSLMDLLRARDLPLTAPALAYAMPPGSPVQQAIAVETGISVLWHDLLAATTSRDLRVLAVRALSDASVRATRWRQAARQSPLTTPWPGLPA